MVFVFMAGPFAPFGVVGGLNTGGVQYRGGLGGSLALSAGLVLLSVLLSSSYPYVVPLIMVLVHFFPDALERARPALEQNKAAAMAALALGLALLWAMQPELGDVLREREMAARRFQQGQQRQRRRQGSAGREYGQAARSVDGFDGSLGGSVVVDFACTVALMVATFLLPQLWAALNRAMLRVLPEGPRERWRAWTRNLRPAAAPPGSVPASRRAVDALEDVVIEERHLLQENSPAGIVCAVCLDAMKIGERVKRLPCKHFFHEPCLMPWLGKHNSCPTCRYELETNDPEYEFARARREEERRQREQRRPRPQAEPRPRPRQHQAASDGGAYEAFATATAQHEEQERLMRLNVLELKAIARRRGVSVLGCVEKRDLVLRIAAAGGGH